MSLPQINATLTRVQQATGGEAFDGPPAPGPDKWTGRLGIYYREARDRARDAEGESRIQRRELIVQTNNPPIAWRSGDVVAFEFDGDELEGTVKIVEKRQLPGVPAGVQTTRLTLES